MKILHAIIKNFRALKYISIPLDKFSVLIGENDVGKTSFLYALEKFFISKKINSKLDFFKMDTSTDIEITIKFTELPEAPGFNDLVDENGDITISKIFPFDSTPTINVLKSDGIKVNLPSTISKSYFSQDNFHLIPVRRDISLQFSMTKTALLGKTLRASMKNSLDEEGATASLTDIKDKLSGAIEEPRNLLEVFMKQQMHNENIRLGFDNLEIDPVEGVTFDVNISDDKIRGINISNRGAGTQNNLIISLFRFIAKSVSDKLLILAMEEPENSLHPKAQRQLLAVLQELSEKNQIIITTHSPVFIERTNFENNIIINRTSSGNSIAKTFNINYLKELRTDLGIRPSDTLLKGGGNCALVVEGNTEEDGMPFFFEMLGLSEFELGIAIINAGGSDFQKIRNICKLLLSYEIPAVVLLDKDAKQTAEDLERCKQKDLTNLKHIYCLTRGTIEDYYPEKIIVKVINNKLNPTPMVECGEIDMTLYGKDKLNNIKKVMYEHNCGDSIEYFKKYLGLYGTRILRDEPQEIDNEIKAVLETVRNIAKS
ncbi:ATP-dependent endonuclease [bacterium]|nr:ATP-dependent endonuclease [bacterium]RQV95280.1 MAG: ATP-dependent endonuclease [bacterium]